MLLLVDHIQDLQRITEHIKEINKQYKINMSIQYKYLSSLDTQRGSTDEIRARIEITENTFYEIKSFFRCKQLSNKHKIKMIRCDINPIQLQ